MKKIYRYIFIVSLFLIILPLTSCDNTESYSDLLKKEEKAVNYFLANQSIVPYIPADGKFQTGEDAPYYRMDNDGNVYMQVISVGEPKVVPEKGERVYFRFRRMNLLNYAEAGYESWSGNADNPASEATSFLYEQYNFSTTSQYGTGIQLPLQYVGYNSYVRLVLKAAAGFANDQSQCIPYLVEIRYFKGEY